MTRNQDRLYYDRGYSDGVKDTKRDSVIPRILGVSFLSLLLVLDQYWILGFVIVWAAFELSEWRDLDKYHESNPPPQ